MVTLLVFIIATLEIVFGRKKLLDAKGPFGDDVFKNPARYIYIAPVSYTHLTLPTNREV